MFYVSYESIFYSIVWFLISYWTIDCYQRHLIWMNRHNINMIVHDIKDKVQEYWLGEDKEYNSAIKYLNALHSACKSSDRFKRFNQLQDKQSVDLDNWLDDERFSDEIEKVRKIEFWLPLVSMRSIPSRLAGVVAILVFHFNAQWLYVPDWAINLIKIVDKIKESF